MLNIGTDVTLKVTTNVNGRSLKQIRAPALTLIYHHCLRGESFVPIGFCRLQAKIYGSKRGILFAHPLQCREGRSTRGTQTKLRNRDHYAILTIRGGRGVRRPPLPRSLANLRRRTGAHLNVTTKRALTIIRELCREKCISCPEAKYHRVPRSVFRRTPALITSLGKRPQFKERTRELLRGKLGPRTISKGDMARRRTLLVAKRIPRKLSPSRRGVCSLVTKEVLRTFSRKYIERIMHIETSCNKVRFRTRASYIGCPK